MVTWRPGEVVSRALPPRARSAPGRLVKLMGVEDLYELFQRGTTLLEQGHNHQAAIPLTRARDLAPDKTSIREALGRALFHIQRYEDAAAEFQAVVEQAPTDDYALFCLGRCLQLLGRHAEARQPLALAATLQPQRRDYQEYRDRARGHARTRSRRDWARGGRRAAPAVLRSSRQLSRPGYARRSTESGRTPAFFMFFTRNDGGDRERPTDRDRSQVVRRRAARSRCVLAEVVGTER